MTFSTMLQEVADPNRISKGLLREALCRTMPRAKMPPSCHSVVPLYDIVDFVDFESMEPTPSMPESGLKQTIAKASAFQWPIPVFLIGE